MELTTLVLENLPLAILAFDAAARLLYGNQAAFALWNLQPEQALGRPVLQLLPLVAIEIPSRAAATPDLELLLSLQNGKLITSGGKRIYCRSLALSHSDSDRPSFLLLSEDLADHQTLAARISEEERLAGVMEISNTLTHKLNQYLQVIMGYVSLLILEIPEEQPAHGYLSKIMEQLENIRLTLYRLNNISRYAVIERPDGRRMFDLEHATNNAGRPWR